MIFMKRLSLPLAALALSSVSAWAQFNPADLWPVLEVSAGQNTALTASPRIDWAVRFNNTLLKTKGKHFDLIFDGDSITDFWQTAKTGKPTWDARYAPLNAVDFGVSGDRIENLLWRLKEGQGADADPKLVVLLIGVNNTATNAADEIAAGIKALLPVYLAQCPHARILLLGLFPCGEKSSDPRRAKIADVNRQIAKLDDGQRVTFLDFGDKFLDPDGTMTKDVMIDFLHPNAKGYRIWADAIQSEIEKTFPNAPKGDVIPSNP